MALFRGPNVVRDGLVLYLDAANRKSYIPPIIVYSVQCYSVYSGGLRSANYTVQYSDDNSTWTTAFTGVMSNNSSCGIITGTGVNTSNLTNHRYWRYVEGSAVAGHHPRVSRIDFITPSGTVYNLVTYTSDNCVDSGTYIVGTVSKDFGPSTILDISNNSNNGTLTNGPSYNAANGGSIVFDGTNDYTYQSLFLNSVTTTLTFDVWVKFNDTGSPGRYIMALGRDVGGPAGGMALIAYGFASASSGQILFEFGSGYGRVSSGIVPTTGIWYNLTVTADGSNTKFYVNGVLKNTASQTTGAVTSSPGLSIGSYLNSSTPPTPGTYFLNGNVGSVKIYNRGLTAAEVLQNYNANKSRFGL